VTTATVVIHGQERLKDAPPEHWKWITAHEIGHQYWIEYVMSAGDEGPEWLMIGLGIYLDRDYSRARGLDARHARFLQTYMDGVREGRDTTLELTPEHFNSLKWDANNIVEHGKGFAVISALDAVLGADVFGRVHRRALREFGGRRLSWRAFQRLAEDESGQYLEWFFEQWVRSNRWLSYEIAGQQTERAGDQYVNRIQVRWRGKLEMPIPVEAELEDGTKIVQWSDRLLREQSVEFRTGSPVKRVRLDPAGALANVVPPPTPAGALSGKIRDLPWSGAAERAKSLYAEAQKAQLAEKSGSGSA
jgi:hypothetical protein